MPILLFSPGRRVVLAARKSYGYSVAARCGRGQPVSYQLVREADHWQMATP